MSKALRSLLPILTNLGIFAILCAIACGETDSSDPQGEGADAGDQGAQFGVSDDDPADSSQTDSVAANDALEVIPDIDPTLLQPEPVPSEPLPESDETAPDADEACGGDGERCCAGNTCSGAFSCDNPPGAGLSNSVCQYVPEPDDDCGGDGEPCCRDSQCDQGFVCNDPLGAALDNSSCELPMAYTDAGAAEPPLQDTPVDGGAANPLDASVAQDTDGGALDAGVAIPQCGGEEQPCCGGTCDEGLACADGSCEVDDGCGGNDEPCCGGECDDGFTCDMNFGPILGGGECVACGGQGQECCDDECRGDLFCDSQGFGADTCRGAVDSGVGGGSCGALGQVCCRGEECDDGLTCDNPSGQGLSNSECEN